MAYIWLLSRMTRFLFENPRKMPKYCRCNVHLWGIWSYYEKCDCTIWCKFPNSKILRNRNNL